MKLTPKSASPAGSVKAGTQDQSTPVESMKACASAGSSGMMTERTLVIKTNRACIQNGKPWWAQAKFHQRVC
jgi:hypothetical protein